MLSKILKKKRDAEDRLRQTSPPVQFVSGLDGEGAEVQSYRQVSETISAAELATWLASKSNINHNHDEVYALISHTHDFILDGGSATGNNEMVISLDLGGA